MMERELERRRGWPWKGRKNLGSDGGSPSAAVKLFDEQEVTRILQDQVRIGDEQMMEALNHATAKHADKERAWSEKLAAANEKLAAAAAEITIKDNLVKQHIKVAEEAVAGWEKAESEAAEFKAELDSVRGTMEERLQEVRGVREEHDRHLHDTIVKKTREFDLLRVEMEVKLAELSQSASESRTQLVEAQAENEALNLALKDRSRMIAELHDARAHAESDSKILRVRLEAMEEERSDLKSKVHSVSKELEIRRAELEYGKKTSDVLSRHHADSIKKILKLEDECNRLRMMVRKKLPNTAAIVRMKQELDALGRESGSDSGRPGRRRPLNRSQSSGVPAGFVPVTLQEDAIATTAVERIATMVDETRMLKEALAKRNDDLQASRLMCAKTATRLTLVEDELIKLRSGSPDLGSPSACSTSSSSSRRVPSKSGSQKFSDFAAEMDVHSRSVNGPEFQQQLIEKCREPEEADRMCEELRRKLTAAENQFSALQSRNAANEQSVIALQDRLDKLLESHDNIPEAEEHIPEAAPEMSVQFQSDLAASVKAVLQATESLTQACSQLGSCTYYQDPRLESPMSNLASIADKLQEQYETHESAKLLLSTLGSITEICNIVTEKLQEDVKAAEEAKSQTRGFETEVQQLQTERADMEAQIQALKEQVKEAEDMIAELRLQRDPQRHEDDLLEEELLELSSSHPQLLQSMRAADAEMNALHSKVAALEVELHGERRRHHEVVAKLEDLQDQIHRGAGRNMESGSVSHSKEFSAAFMEEDEINKNARQEREISASALAECQRTILALGKQLKLLGFSETPDLTRLKGADSPDSIKRMTETMELLRWQTESASREHQPGPPPPPPPPPRKVLCDFSSDGPVSVPASPARSDLEAPSTPESPAAARRTVSVRTVRSFQLQQHPEEEKFHDRSLSESSLSSGLSNGNSH